ncbi:glycine dehydrogenase subunit 2 [Candidatus Termititenax aidoneus]|uniref:Probable glycine dehydrogenase (decarboxylating) subunit 2 n=1 Tax=Termititenax aidoneus TaxID=2218524 RepID=A0A388T8I4_TERA1|nr:glycine dehydrogenase subunit 2 [Candidatus Termititenax aidoneus]
MNKCCQARDSLRAQACQTQGRMAEKLIFEYSQKGRKAHTLPDAPPVSFGLPERKGLRLPEVSEVDVTRHYTKLSQQNYGVDSGFYPLGSCTMKYNPKINEQIAACEEFAEMNPYEPERFAAGLLKILYAAEQMLCQTFGYARFTLQPAAGAHGEFTGLLIIRAYHLDRGDTQRVKILVPDAAHGTNPASCALAGFQIVTIRSLPDGGVDLNDLKKHLDNTVAGLMLTNPNTLGLFEKNILPIAELVHNAGGLLYYDGANANATLGLARPADMGFDVCHLNLHKTFATPHGGGGPGSGPVGVTTALAPYLPRPLIDFQNGKYYLNNDRPKSIGKVHSFYGNVGVILRAYAYLKIQGSAGLKRASELAVLNANYVKARLQKVYNIPYPQICQHEFVISVKEWKKQYGVSAADIAKRLMDYGYHPPTIYFPLIVPECLMIEPTETESKETLDAFCDAMLKIATEVKTNPELVKSAPHSTIIGRLDEVKAVKEPDLNYFAGA